MSKRKSKFWLEKESIFIGLATYHLALCGLPADLAEDVVQEAFLRFESTISNKRKAAWEPELRTAIRHLVIDLARKRDNHTDELPHPDTTPSATTSQLNELIDRDLRQQADEELSKELLPVEREALRLHITELKTHKEIGRILGVSDRQVRRYILTGLKKTTVFLNENRDRFSF